MVPLKVNEHLEEYINQEIYVQIAIIKGTIGKLMWSNCKACHSKYRKPH